MSEDVMHTPTIAAQAEATRRVVTTEEPHGDWLVVRVFVCSKAVYAELGKNDIEIAKVREDAVYCAKSWHQELAHALFVYGEKREQAAYERGKAAGKVEGAREERVRILEGIKPLMAEAEANDRECPYGDHDLGGTQTLQNVINIVNQK